MIKLKISFFTLGLVSGLLAGYFFAQWQYRLSVSRAGSPCNQSATTTDCRTLLNQLKSGATSSEYFDANTNISIQERTRTNN